MRLVVGLGNPGNEYAATRHNVGFEALDRLAQRLGWISQPDDYNRLAKTKFDALVIEGSLQLLSGGSEKVMLLKPLTFMNLSGNTVSAACGFFQTPPENLMVVLDDLALPCGTLRIRADGSSGGHNGLKDIERVLGTNAYPRLRLGIDPAPPRVAGRDYVLGRFTAEQRRLLEPAIDRAAGAIATWVDGGIALAMNRFNGAATPSKP